MSPRPPAALDRADRDPAGPAALAVVLPALAGALASVVVIGFQPDDLFIYLRMVDNVLGGRGWGFNPGEAVNVASSAVWLFVLVGLGAVTGPSAEAAQLASGFASAAGVAGTACLAGRLAGDSRAAWAAGLALAGDAWMGRWFWSGMESGLAVAVATWALALRVRARPGTARDAAAGALFAIAPLVRPELVVLPVAAMAASALEGARGRWTRVATDAALLAAALAGWSAFALATFGSILPSTVAAKGTLGAAHITSLGALGRVALVVASTQGLALAAALTLGARWAWPRAATSETAPGRREAARTILLFAALLAGGYAVQHVKVYTRYVLPLTALVVALGLGAAVSCARSATSRAGRWLPLAIVAATLAGNAAFGTLLVVPKTRAYARSMREVVVPLAERLAAETAPDATIAVPDIGAIGFLTGRRILDLNGLATPEVVRYKREGRLGELLRERTPEVLIGIEPQPRRWPPRLPDVPLEEIGVYRFDGMFVRGPDPMYLTVYRLTPPGEAPGREPGAGAPGS